MTESQIVDLVRAARTYAEAEWSRTHPADAPWEEKSWWIAGCMHGWLARAEQAEAAPCPYVVTSSGGTSHCRLAEADARDAVRLAAEIHNHFHPEGPSHGLIGDLQCVLDELIDVPDPTGGTDGSA